MNDQYGPMLKRLIPIAILVALIIAVVREFPSSLVNHMQCDFQNLSGATQASNGFYMDKQIIITGPQDEVDAVIQLIGPVLTIGPDVAQGPTTAVETPVLPTTTAEATETPGVTTATETGILRLIEGCDLGYLNTRTAPNSDTPVEQRQLVMRLYEIAADIEVKDVIDQIKSIAQGNNPTDQTYDISVDPNYLTSFSDETDPCGRPNSDPGSGGGRPFGDPTILDKDTAVTVFRDQWAFGSQGINLPSTPTVTGRGVRVAVFDTSPYRISPPSIIIRRMPLGFPSPMWFTTWDVEGGTLASNHGLAVAALIHRAAPHSQIRIVRVLDDGGCGQLWWLIKGLEDYTDRMSSWSGTLNKTVINMSLGIRVPDTGLAGMEDEDVDLDILGDAITRADTLGAILVAAAGNDSDNAATAPKPMQIPANHPLVFGVAATAPDGTPTCYTNQGDVAAPGGNGGPVLLEDGTTDPCAPMTDPNPCPASDLANCKYGLISVARTHDGPRYILWSGTSFATPLVSGLAALAYQNRDHDAVRCMIESGASLRLLGTISPDPVIGWGIVNITESLGSTTCP